MRKKRVVITHKVIIRLIQFLGALLYKKDCLIDKMVTNQRKNQVQNHVITMSST
jgi:hypothetical protein